jgi:hypothetical protein
VVRDRTKKRIRVNWHQWRDDSAFPGHMAMLLRAALPLTLNAKQAELRDYLTEAEVRERLAALGMPWQSIYQLEHHPPDLLELGEKEFEEALENLPTD